MESSCTPDYIYALKIAYEVDDESESTGVSTIWDIRSLFIVERRQVRE